MEERILAAVTAALMVDSPPLPADYGERPSDDCNNSGDLLGDLFGCIGDGVGWMYEHTDISLSVCPGYGCAGIGFQGGTMYIQRGVGPALGGGLNIGLASREYEDRGCSLVTGFYGPAYVTGNGEEIRDWEAGGSIGVGAGVANNWTYDGEICTE